jgi:hypothetical protein
MDFDSEMLFSEKKRLEEKQKKKISRIEPLPAQRKRISSIAHAVKKHFGDEAICREIELDLADPYEHGFDEEEIAEESAWEFHVAFNKGDLELSFLFSLKGKETGSFFVICSFLDDSETYENVPVDAKKVINYIQTQIHEESLTEKPADVEKETPTEEEVLKENEAKVLRQLRKAVAIGRNHVKSGKSSEYASKLEENKKKLKEFSPETFAELAEKYPDINAPSLTAEDDAFPTINNAKNMDELEAAFKNIMGMMR